MPKKGKDREWKKLRELMASTNQYLCDAVGTDEQKAAMAAKEPEWVAGFGDSKKTTKPSKHVYYGAKRKKKVDEALASIIKAHL